MPRRMRVDFMVISRRRPCKTTITVSRQARVQPMSAFMRILLLKLGEPPPGIARLL
jgi:hypothetical protein